MKLIITENTRVKAEPEQSALLDDFELLGLKKGVEIPLTGCNPALVEGHFEFKIDRKDIGWAQGFDLGISEKWYAFAPHAKREGNSPNNAPNDKPSTAIETPKSKMDFAFKLPGFKSTFNMANPIVKGGRLYWYEALHFDPATKGYRPPEDKAVVNNIVRLANILEHDIRPRLKQKFDKDTILVNSWYRDPVTNRNVGGASQSRHMWGDAIDFVVPGVHPYDVNDELNPDWRGGLASASIFTHLDARDSVKKGGRGTGARSRWRYGF